MSVIKIIQEQIQKIEFIKKLTLKLSNSLQINFNDILNKLNNDLSQIEFDTKETEIH